MTTQTSITWKDKEVENPILRFLIVVFLVLCALIVVGAVLALSPLFLILHFILICSGRKGFITITQIEFNWAIDRSSFRKVV